jgi:hypothetical protein
VGFICRQLSAKPGIISPVALSLAHSVSKTITYTDLSVAEVVTWTSMLVNPRDGAMMISGLYEAFGPAAKPTIVAANNITKKTSTEIKDFLIPFLHGQKFPY